MTLMRTLMTDPGKRRARHFLVLCLVVATMVIGVTSLAEWAIKRYARAYVTVESVRWLGSRFVLEGVRTPYGTVRVVRVDVAWTSLLKKEWTQAVRHVELDEPRIVFSEHFDSSDEGQFGVPPLNVTLTIRDGRYDLPESGDSWSIDGTMHVRSTADGVFGSARLHRVQGPDVDGKGAVRFVCDVPAKTCTARIEAGDARIFHHDVAVFAGDVFIDERGWTLNNGQGTGRRDERFTLIADGTFRSEEPITMTMDAQGMSVHDVLEWFAPDFPGKGSVEGRLGGRIQFQFESAGLSMSGSGTLTSGRLADARIERGDVQFRKKGERTDVSAAIYFLRSGRMVTEELTMAEGRVDGTVSVDGIPVSTLQRALKGIGVSYDAMNNMTGRVSGDLHLGGSTATGLTGSLDVRGERLAYEERMITPVYIGVDWDERTGWTVRDGMLGPVHVEGHGDFQGDFIVHGRWDDVHFSDVSSFLIVDEQSAGFGMSRGYVTMRRENAEMEATGDVYVEGGGQSARGLARMTYSIAEGMTWTGEATIGSGTLHVRGSRNVQGEIVTAVQIDALPVGHSRLTAKGHMDVNDQGWRAVFEGTSPEVVYGDYRLADGKLVVDVTSRGEKNGAVKACLRDCLWGEVVLRGNVDAPKANIDPDSEIHWHVTFDGARARVQPWSMGIGSGRIELTGEGTVDPGEGWRADVRSVGRNVPVHVGGIALQSDYTLRLHGLLSAFNIEGDVRVTEGEIDLLRLPSLRSKSTLSAGSFAGGGVGGLDVSVRLDHVHVLARSLLDVDVAGRLDVRGTTLRPEVYGGVGVQRGAFRYGRARFDIVEGEVSFNGVDLIPRLDVMGETLANGQALHIDVQGPVDRLAFGVYVDGRPDASGIDRLLRTGMPGEWDGGDWSELGRSLLAWLDEEIITDAYWQISRVLERTLAVDRLRIEQHLDGDDWRLSVGKYISPDLYFSYRRTLTAENKQDVGVEYTIAPGIRLRSRWGGKNSSDFGMEMQFPF